MENKQIQYEITQIKYHSDMLRKETANILSSILWDLDNEIKDKYYQKDLIENARKIFDKTDGIEIVIKDLEYEFKMANREEEKTEEEEEIELPL